jgi:hypothetical protein
MKRTIILPGLVAVFVALSPAAVAVADNAHNGNTTGTTTGQPNQSNGSANAPQAPSGFNSGGFANAETHYANPDSTGGVHSGNSHVVSQYDVAAFEFSHRGP